MKRYAITAATFKGEITYSYNKDGYLIGFSNSSDINIEKQGYILKNMPLTATEMVEKFMKSSKVKVIEIPFIITFEMFWDKYNDKVRSSKKRSLIIWNRLSEADKVKAYLFIAIYERNRGSAEKKLCETFLNAEQWNN